MINGTMWDPRLDPEQRMDINGKTGKIQIQSVVQSIELYQCYFLSFNNFSMVM